MAKFKVGDRVQAIENHTFNGNGDKIVQNEIYTITRIVSDHLHLKELNGVTPYAHRFRFYSGAGEMESYFYKGIFDNV